MYFAQVESVLCIWVMGDTEHIDGIICEDHVTHLTHVNTTVKCTYISVEIFQTTCQNPGGYM